MVRLVLVLALAVASFGQSAPGQPSPPRTPTRDTPATDSVRPATAVLRGAVMAADTGKPLRRAMVRATAQDGRGSGVATTDADGRFEIRQLVAGRYSIAASKAGYVPTQFGQRRPEQPGTVLDVLDGQIVEKISIALPRGGVITGRVTDEFGDPVAGVAVSAMRFRFVNGARRLMSSGGAATDDLGAFRIFGLTPGEYYVSGNVRSNVSMLTTGAPGAGDVEGFAPTYYPGTPNANEAQRVTVRASQETAGLNFALTATRLARITGRVIASNGQPVIGGFLSLRPADPYDMSMMMFMSAQTRPDGTFQMNGVAAGSYHLMVQPRGRPSGESEFGRLPITVAGGDIDNVVVATARGATLHGIIRSDENAPLPLDPQQVAVYVRSLQPDINIGGAEPKVNADWSFELGGLFERGAIIANITGASDWAFKAVYLNGQDVTDEPLEFSPGASIGGVEVVITRKTTELTGTVTDDRSRPVLDATIIAFAQDSARWTFGTRFIRTARVDQSGRYQLRGLPPGDYFVIAVQDLEPGRQSDPELLNSLSRFASRASLDEAGTMVQDLKVTGMPQ
jgi:hypothetical protein